MLSTPDLAATVAAGRAPMRGDMAIGWTICLVPPKADAMPPILGEVLGLDSAARRLDMRVGGDRGRAGAADWARSICDWD